MAVRQLALGNINIDIYIVVREFPGPDEDVTAEEAYVGPGGAAANYAVAASLAGSAVSLAAHTGRMAVELGILSGLREKGVDTSFVVIHEDKPPGIIVILVRRDTGERSMVTMKGANALLRGDEASGSYNVVHIASHGPQVVERAARSVDYELLSYDPGAGVARRLGREALRLSVGLGVVYLNRAELRMVAGAEPTLDTLLQLARETSAEYVVLKMGGEGAAVAYRGSVFRVEAYRHGEPVDTTGAGDVFAAYFNTFIAEGRSIEEALKAASIAAGIKVTRRGAQGAPSREEVEDILASPRAPRAWRAASG